VGTPRPSQHFFGDPVRRRDVLNCGGRRQAADSRGGLQASRPQTRGTTELPAPNMRTAGVQHAIRGTDNEAENDGSFRGWTCAEGLSMPDR